MERDRPTACFYPAKKLNLVLITLCEFFFPYQKRDDEITCFIPMKYTIFLGKGALPLATPSRGPFQPSGPRKNTYRSAFFARRLPPISKCIDVPGWNLHLSCVLTSTVMF